MYAIRQRDPRHDFLSDYLSPIPALVAGETGISAEKIQALAEEFHRASGSRWHGIAVNKQQLHKLLCSLNAAAITLAKLSDFTV